MTGSRRRTLIIAAVIAALAIAVVWRFRGGSAGDGAGAGKGGASDGAASDDGTADDTPGGPKRPIRAGIAGDDDPTILVSGAPAVVEGVVRDAASKAAIPDAEVAFWSKRGELTTESGADGHYKLDVTTGAWSARASAGDDGLSVAQLVRVDAPHVTVDLDVQKLAHVHGVVRDAASHAPVAGVVVSVEPPDKAMREALEATAAGRAVQSGGDGSYRLAVPPGEVRLLATAQGKLGHRAIPAVAPGGDAVADLELKRDVSIDGRVVDGKGAGVGGATVTVFLAIYDIDLNHKRTVTTGADGRFEAHGLEPGMLTIDARTGDGGATDAKLIDVSGGDQHDLVLTMSPAIAIRGHVKYSDGRAAPGATVKLRRTGIAGVIAEATTDKDGAFEAHGPAAKYEISASDEYGTARLLDVAGDADIELVIRIPGGIRGTVHTKAGPVADFTVAIDSVLLPGNERAQNPPAPQRYTPADGTFEWAHLDPGTYELTIRGGGAVAHVHAVAVPERDWATLDVLLDGAVGVAGRVHAGEQPIANARVDAGCTGASSVTGADGSFAFPDAPAGDCAITISAEGYASAQRRAHAGAPLDVDLAGTAKGKTDLTGIGVVLEPWKGAAHVIGVVAPSAQQLQAGDVIEQVDGVDVTSLGFAGMIASIRGDAGTHVKLKVRRGAAEVELDLVRGHFTYDGSAPGVA